MILRKKYVNNNMPTFKIPEKNKKIRPFFINYAMKKASEVDVTKSELYYIIQPKDIKTGKIIKRYRSLNKHRANALKAMVLAMLYHFNLSSNLVYASIEQLSDECGLSTISQAGNKSISRASRLISQFMEPMGFLKTEKKWDRILGNYMPKTISLTPLFFKLFNVSSDRLKKAQKKQLDWINKCLIKKGLDPITKDQAIKNSKNIRINKILEFRKSKHNFYIRQKRAKKIISINECTARQNILKILVKNYSLKELQKLGQNGLKKKVNIEYFHLKKIANLSYQEKNNLNI